MISAEPKPIIEGDDALQPRHFDELTPDEQQSMIARIHPSFLAGGMWVSPGAPRADELRWWKERPAADLFCKQIARLTREQAVQP